MMIRWVLRWYINSLIKILTPSQDYCPFQQENLFYNVL